MQVEIDYETICVNCKEKGYSFGYTLKKISYQKQLVLDLPQPYLNGPCLAFNYCSVPILIRSLENSHALNNPSKQPIFAMINAKHNKNSTLSRFTYRYIMNFHPEIQKITPNDTELLAYIIEYVDVYRFISKPYILFFYSFRNVTPNPLKDINFYQFYDFDIYGQDYYDSDRVDYDSTTGAIFQYDSRFPLEKGLIAGIVSVKDRIPTHFEGNTPESILISPERLKLRDFLHPHSTDLSIGLQWSIPSLGPNHVEIFPVALVFGQGLADFQQNVNQAQNELDKLLQSVSKAIEIPSRQQIDQKLEKMSFSMTEWCKD